MFDGLLMTVVNGVDHRKRKRSPSAVTQESHRDRRTSKRETEEQMQFREFMSQLAVVLLEYTTPFKWTNEDMILRRQ